MAQWGRERDWVRDVLVPHALLLPFLVLCCVGTVVLWAVLTLRRLARGERPSADP